MTSRLVLSIICCALPLVAHATDIYRWVDDQGRTHFTDVVPERYKSVATKIDSRSFEPSEGARTEAAAGVARERSQAEFEAAQRARSQAAKTAAPPSSTSSASQPPRIASGETECDRLWRAYRESEECFAPYMRRRGGTRVEAYQQCQQLPSPAQQCGPPK
jgi:hypothetical protein